MACSDAWRVNHVWLELLSEYILEDSASAKAFLPPYFLWSSIESEALFLTTFSAESIVRLCLHHGSSFTVQYTELLVSPNFTVSRIYWSTCNCLLMIYLHFSHYPSLRSSLSVVSEYPLFIPLLLFSFFENLNKYSNKFYKFLVIFYKEFLNIDFFFNTWLYCQGGLSCTFSARSKYIEGESRLRFSHSIDSGKNRHFTFYLYFFIGVCRDFEE